MSLLDDAKLKLRVTWEEEDARIQDMIESAKDYFKRRTSTDFDYDAPGQPKTLLLNRVFYEYSNELHNFEINYLSEILELQLTAAIELSKAQSGDENV